MQFTEPGSVGWKENPFATESGEESNGIFSQVSIETDYGVQEEQEEVEEPFGANLYDSQEEGATEEKGKTGGKERECTPEIILEDTQKEGEVKNARGFTIDERYNKPDEWGSSIDENDSNDRTGDTDGFRYYNVHGDATTSSKRALDNSGEHEDLLKEEEAGEGYE
ncbi:hypothetical protein AX774_g6508 [Zancudomyces culisetae]|uniref:Uncharacterized protein n=1 Tax=Zancudomyces culisetae TaxID=1213189 RepID=A0A1R1PGG1_ZANCU|nr:hypothetical protein AX774_g6508 [Zancudomyces culisetae]|eukprot:OMH80066.1 hypothetical protein AX774_g6508 [Zancudomyces culisetae]